MKTLRRVLVAGLGLLAIAALGVFVAGRFSDGPLGFFSGGPFTSGDPAAAVQDWSFAQDTNTVELQLLEPARSRTVWVAVVDGVAYIPCGVPNFRLWKQWPHDAVRNGAALVQTGGRILPVQLVKDEDPARFAAVAEQLGTKYNAGSSDSLTPEMLWLFRLDPRPAG